MRRVLGVVNDARVCFSSGNPSAFADAVSAFFAEYEVASLRLPSGWFGRPHDNWHQLTQATMEGENLLVRLDDTQVLTLQAEAVSSDGRVLRIASEEGAGTGPSTAATRNTPKCLDRATSSSTPPSSPKAARDLSASHDALIAACEDVA